MQPPVPIVMLSLNQVSLLEIYRRFAEFIIQCYMKTSAIDGISYACMISVILIELVHAYNSPFSSTMVDRQISIQSNFHAGALRLAFLRAACRTSPSPHSSTRLACEVNPLPTIPLSSQRCLSLIIKIEFEISSRNVREAEAEDCRRDR